MKTLVNWLNWDSSSFERAKKENKPIILNLTAVWCHWCHVNDKENYNDKDIADYINKYFIPIRVDIDKRPDIKERYHFGGFPSTVFLNNKAEIIQGYTYLPREYLESVLKDIKENFNFKKPILHKTKDYGKCLLKIDNSIIDDVLSSLISNFDESFGGFGLEPKFPMPEAIELLLVHYENTKNKQFLLMALKTLDSMLGIFDTEEYGFFRYATRVSWSVPHYEKMLESNAGLLKNYLHAFIITKDKKYKDTAEKVLIYIKNNLSSPNGGFYGSQDADEIYYLLPLKEREKKPFVDKTVYTDWSCMMVSSYIFAYKILNDEYLKQFAIKSIEFKIKNLYGKEKGTYHYFDKERNVPGLLSDNVSMICTLLDLYDVTKEKRYLSLANSLVKFLEKFKNKQGLYSDKLNTKEDIGLLEKQNDSIVDNSKIAKIFIRLNKLKEAEILLLVLSCDYRKYNLSASE
ncbi:thioredoxin domain-containing protein, partial [Candidatus Woesearchaeota archaeon]|nr:thioredoxin domain-containing protein [Candidatus Woesearchaeota archaeon]